MNHAGILARQTNLQSRARLHLLFVVGDSLLSSLLFGDDKAFRLLYDFKCILQGRVEALAAFFRVLELVYA